MPTGIARRGIGSRPGIGQSQIGNKYGIKNAQEPFVYSAGAGVSASYTFKPTKSGYWKFVIWGGGANGVNGSGFGGGSGAFIEATRFLTTSSSVTLSVGTRGVDSSATFPNGEVLTAGAGTAPTGGTATAAASDIAINGSDGGSAGASGSAGGGTNGGAAGTGGAASGGAGAPGNDNYGGGGGGSKAGAGAPGGSAPGGGGAGTTDVSSAGAPGMIIVAFISD